MPMAHGGGSAIPKAQMGVAEIVPNPLGVVSDTPIWPRGRPNHLHLAGMGVVSHLHGHWEWTATPKWPIGVVTATSIVGFFFLKEY
jgi:hypothetical protein